jgi:hypothetical protein
MRIIPITLLLVIYCLTGKAQTSFRHFIPINIHAGGSLANLESISGSGISQRPGISLALQSGYMIRYKDRVGFSLGGGVILNEYRFSAMGALSSDYYSVAYYALNARARVFALFPLKRNKHSVLSVSATAGYRFIGNDQLNGSLSALSAQTNTIKQLRPFIEPEIGLTKMLKHNQIDIAITYHLGLIPDPPFFVQLNTPFASSRATSGLNYAALVVRLNPEILHKRHSKLPVNKEPDTPAVPLLSESSEFNARENRSRYSYKVSKKKLLLKIRDNSEIDGDTLSVYVNNKPVLIRYGLQAKAHKVKLILEPGENTITLVAHNEGKVPPNTAECILRSGFKTIRMNTASGMRYNEVVNVNYEP